MQLLQALLQNAVCGVMSVQLFRRYHCSESTCQLYCVVSQDISESRFRGNSSKVQAVRPPIKDCYQIVRDLCQIDKTSVKLKETFVKLTEIVIKLTEIPVKLTVTSVKLIETLVKLTGVSFNLTGSVNLRRNKYTRVMETKA